MERLPSPIGFSPEACAVFGERVRARAGYVSNGDLYTLVRAKLGGVITLTDRDCYDFVHIPDQRQLCITLDVTRGNYAALFAVAEALGHHFLHFPVWGPLYVPSPSLGGCDIAAGREAKWFAMGFLMPEALLRRAWQETEGSPVRVARHFCIDTPPVRLRAQNLGLL